MNAILKYYTDDLDETKEGIFQLMFSFRWVTRVKINRQTLTQEDNSGTMASSFADVTLRGMFSDIYPFARNYDC